MYHGLLRSYRRKEARQPFAWVLFRNVRGGCHDFYPDVPWFERKWIPEAETSSATVSSRTKQQNNFFMVPSVENNYSLPQPSRTRRYVSSSSSGRTRVCPSADMKLVSPPQRGTMCMWT